MAVGALLGVVILGSHAKHVVTLGTDAVQDWLPRCRSFPFWGMSLGRFRIHSAILAQQGATGRSGAYLGWLAASRLE
jgi:hypothetical protein